MPRKLQSLQHNANRNLGHARSILQRLEKKEDLANLNPSDINEFYKRAASDLVDQQGELKNALRKWQAVASETTGPGRETSARIREMSLRLQVLDTEIAALRQEGLRKTANGYAFKPSRTGMNFLFDHDFIDLASPSITPYYVKAYKTRLDPAQSDPARRWVLVKDNKGNPVEESYRVFGIQIKPDPADPHAHGKNRQNYQVYMHAMLDESRPDARSDDGKSYHPDSALQYKQYKWKRGDEHRRGKMWLDRQQSAMATDRNGRGLQSNAEIYRNFTAGQSFRECVPRYLKMTGPQSWELEEVDLRKLQRKGAR